MSGINKYVTETSQEIPIASVENGGTEKPVAKAKPRPKPTFYVDSCVDSISLTKMDGRWSRKIQPRLFWSVKIHDQITATWRFSSSRRWWSSKIWRLGRYVQGKVWWFFAMVNWSLTAFLAKGGPQKRFQYRLNPRSYIARQCTVAGCLRRVPLPHRERSRVVLHPVRIDSNRKTPRGTSSQCVFHSSEPDARQSRSGRNSIRSGPTHIRGVQKYVEISPTCSIKMQSEARSKKRIAVLSNPIASNCTFQHTTCDLYWESGKHEDWRGFILKFLTITKVTARRTYAKFAMWTSGSSQSGSEKIHRPSQRTKRQVQGNLFLTSRGYTSQATPEKVSDGSTGKLDAVTLITEFQVFLTQPSRKKTRIARKPSKDWFNSSRTTRTGTR